MAKSIKLPEIPDAERNQRIDELLALIVALLSGLLRGRLPRTQHRHGADAAGQTGLAQRTIARPTHRMTPP